MTDLKNTLKKNASKAAPILATLSILLNPMQARSEETILVEREANGAEHRISQEVRDNCKAEAKKYDQIAKREGLWDKGTKDIAVFVSDNGMVALMPIRDNADAKEVGADTVYLNEKGEVVKDANPNDFSPDNVYKTTVLGRDGSYETYHHYSNEDGTQRTQKVDSYRLTLLDEIDNTLKNTAQTGTDFISKLVKGRTER